VFNLLNMTGDAEIDVKEDLGNSDDCATRQDTTID